MEAGGGSKVLKKILFGTSLALFLTIIVVLPCSLQPVKAEPSNIIATCGQGYLRNIDGLLVLNLKGSPYEMGYQHGFLLRDRVQANIQHRVQAMADMFSYDYLVSCAQALLPHIPEEYIEEIHGLADGADMNYTDVLIMQLEGDIMSYGPGWTGCSGFAVLGNATVDGHLYHGRSLDARWCLPPDEPIGLVTVCEPESGNAFVNVGWFGFIGVATGMNRVGISAATKASSSADKTLDGMPAAFLVREVLQYSNNLPQAIDVINRTDRTTGRNIVLGDGKNLEACVVEMSANYSKVFWAGDPEENIEPHYSIPNAVRRTNHYVDPELAATQRDPYDPRLCGPAWNNSWLRYERLSQLIEDNYGNISAEMSIEFLRTPPVAWDPINAQSTVFDSTDLELWVANANSTTPAYLREFVHLSWDDLFPQYDLTISSTAGGDVTAPGEGTFTYDAGAVVSLVATPDPGYRFDKWTGNVSTIADVNAPATNVTVYGDYSITANFKRVGWCFIATAAYGTPMAQEIEILREFRDEYLLTSPVGQALVDFYYRVSPPMAEFITEHPSLKPIVRAGLLPAVAMSAVVVNTTPVEKMTIVGLLVVVSVATTAWTMRRRN
jgi:isopenicillin-N N-acyltransferase-like protein